MKMRLINELAATENWTHSQYLRAIATKGDFLPGNRRIADSGIKDTLQLFAEKKSKKDK
jgi:hypothetical protein